MVCTLLAGVNVVAFAADEDSSDSVSVLRAYNPNNGEHLMTIDQAEYEANVARGYSGEGTAWKAPTASSTPIYRIYNPNSGEHMLTANAAECPAGWQAEGQKMYSDDEQGVPIYRVFNPNATDAGSHHYCGKEEATGLVARGWNWDNNGEPVLYGVDDGTIVESAKIVDVSGLQADGTGLVGDTLQVTYTSELGNPTQVTWYKNGSAVETKTSSAAQGLDFTFEVLDTPVKGAGTYYAVITNTKGETYKSDSLVVSALPVKAIVTDYTLTEDHNKGVAQETGTSSVEYNKESGKLVATFTVNKKAYVGLVGLVESEKVLAGNAKKDDVTRKAPVSTLAYAQVKAKADFTDEKAEENSFANGGAKFGIYYENGDGSVSYKWVVNTNTDDNGDPTAFNKTLTRGTNYVLGFAQKDVSKADDLNSYVIGGMYDAPYVEAPESISITKCAPNDKAEVTFFDSEGNKMEWLGGIATQNPQNIGIKEAVIYKNTSNGETGKTVLDGTAKNVSKGVLESTVDVDPSFSYYWAEVTFNEGIYDEGEVTLKTPIQKIATKSADAMSIYESTTAPADATVLFTNLATDGTVYVINAQNADKAAEALKKNQTVGDNKIVGYAEADRGDSRVTVSNCLKSTEATATNYDNYFAIFVPDNEEEYSKVATTDATHNPGEVPETIDRGTYESLEMKQLPAGYSIVSSISNLKAAAATGAQIYCFDNVGGTATVTQSNYSGNDDKNLVKIVDQFGYELTAANYAAYGAANKLGSWNLTQSDSTKTEVKNVTVEITLADNGFTGIKVGTYKADGITNVAVDANTTWTGKTAAGQTITVKTKADGSWTITF